jgi:cobalt-zinc-cadmium efflux system membrane fusion protein
LVSLENATVDAVPTNAIVNHEGQDYIFIVTDAHNEEEHHEEREIAEHKHDEERSSSMKKKKNPNTKKKEQPLKKFQSVKEQPM